MNTIFYQRQSLKRKKSKDVNYDRLRTIRKNPKEVIIEDIETGEMKTFPSIYKASKFIEQAPQMITYWDGRVWKNKYKVLIQ